MNNKISVFWFRRDLRLEDNTAFYHALASEKPVLPIFIFDNEILEKLPKDDARVTFIYNTLKAIDEELKKVGSSLLILKGNPINVWKKLVADYEIETVFFNKDYEPYAIKRDKEVVTFLAAEGINCNAYKDQVIFEENEVLKKDGTPYTVYTPYKNQWLSLFKSGKDIVIHDCKAYKTQLLQHTFKFPEISELGFTNSTIQVKPYNLSELEAYKEVRDFPALDKTSYLSPHLRFGLVSIRQMVIKALETNATFLSELIWREFFMQILYHFPKVVTENFKEKYNAVAWRNNEQEFEKWCKGETGYPIVDAGMRELNTTGYMHNRVRMITASFLCKHLLIDWRWGEAYFAEKLVDYELASNNGNWQWAASTGCDAVPYFRIFNPTEQLKKFDKDLIYTKKWVSDLNELMYPQPMVDHKFARERALQAYKEV